MSNDNDDVLKIETSYWSLIPLDPDELYKFAEEATDEIERLESVIDTQRVTILNEIRKLYLDCQSGVYPARYQHGMTSEDIFIHKLMELR